MQQKGMTLLEFAIVLVTFAILAVIAIPAYNEWSCRQAATSDEARNACKSK